MAATASRRPTAARASRRLSAATTPGKPNSAASPSASATVPVLVMDLYEHSYQMDYGAAVAKYVDAFFDNVNWDVVAQRLPRAGGLP
jgi:superoxide dismutase